MVCFHTICPTTDKSTGTNICLDTYWDIILHKGTDSDIVKKSPAAFASAECWVLCKMPRLALWGDNTTWLSSGSAGIEFSSCTTFELASIHLPHSSKRNVLYLFLTLYHRRALQKVTSDQLLLAVSFFSLSGALCRRQLCHQNTHCPYSKTVSGQISHRRSDWGTVYFILKRATYWKKAVITCIKCS